MEIKLGGKQIIFVTVWTVALIVALLLVATYPYMNTLYRTEKFGELLFLFGGAFTLFLIGFDSLTK